MKELIKAYQSGTSNEVVEKVLNYVDTVENMKYKGESNVDDALKFVANRIRAIIIKSVFKEREKDIKLRKEETDEWYEELWDYISGLADADWIELDYKAIFNYDFTSIYEKREEIARYLKEKAIELFMIVDKFSAMQTLEGNEEFKGSYTGRKGHLLPYFKEALEYALTKVDASKSEKEIIKYINKAMLTKFIEVQMREENVKRIRKGNKSVYIKVEIEEGTDAWMLMFGKTLKHIDLTSFDLWLTAKQRKFIESVYNFIVEDLENNNVEAFKWSKDGKPVLNKRYLADKMNMEETNFKQTLKRCEKKIKDNWKEAINSWLSKK